MVKKFSLLLITLIFTIMVASCSEIVNTVTTRGKKGDFLNDLSKNNKDSLTNNEIKKLEKEYKSFSTKALSDAYVSRMFNKFLTTSPNPAQVIRQLEFARYLKDIKSELGYFNSLKTFINGDSAKFNLINNSNGVTVKKLAESATFGSFVDSLNPNPSPTSLLLDTYPTASVAYSLRKLRNAYVGNAVRVRRSSDNAEQNIGFTTGGDLDTTSLSGFIGSSSGFVTTWYDQSGNGKDLVQSFAASQPKIVNSGVLLTKNSKPAIEWSDTDGMMLNSTNINMSTSFTSILIFTPYSTSTKYRTVYSIGTNSQNNYYALYSRVGVNYSDWITGDFMFLGNGWDSTSNPRMISNGQPFTSNTQYFTFGMLSNTENIFKYNNTLLTAKINTTGNTAIGSKIVYLGNGNSGLEPFYGNIQEAIFYTNNQTSNRSGFESDINSYYSIY